MPDACRRCLDHTRSRRPAGLCPGRHRVRARHPCCRPRRCRRRAGARTRLLQPRRAWPHMSSTLCEHVSEPRRPSCADSRVSAQVCALASGHARLDPSWVALAAAGRMTDADSSQLKVRVVVCGRLVGAAARSKHGAVTEVVAVPTAMRCPVYLACRRPTRRLGSSAGLGIYRRTGESFRLRELTTQPWTLPGRAHHLSHA